MKERTIFVLVPSGSGKTFFAVKSAAAYNVDKDKSQGLDYWAVVHVMATGFEITGKIEDWIVEKVKSLIKNVSPNWNGCQLEMHLLVVIDEARRATTNAEIKELLFESMSTLDAIYLCLLDLATSVRLIIDGTGLTAEKLNSENQVTKYRSKSWTRNDVLMVRDLSFQFQKLFENFMYEQTIITYN
jgi:hypothetical protein